MKRFALLAAAVTVFLTYSANAATLTTLATFRSDDGGYYVEGGLIADAAGNLYGTTVRDSAEGEGTVFRIDAGTNKLVTLARIGASPDLGSTPRTGLVADAAGNLYGTTNLEVFRLEAGTNILSSVYRFGGVNGITPQSLIINAAGDIYGTTTAGGASFGGSIPSAQDSWGTVYRLNSITGVRTTLVDFNVKNGARPEAGLVADIQGNLYGTTSQGGSGGPNQTSFFGTVFKVDAATNSLTTLHNFDGMDGSSPQGSLVLDTDGNLYGTTATGGAFGKGTVFRLDALTNNLTTLVDFNGANGEHPISELIVDKAGNLFGTTEEGGAFGAGTIFRIDAGINSLTTLVDFTDEIGRGPSAGLIADAGGNLYGTTHFGGPSNGSGTVFRLSDAGFVTSLSAVPEPGSWAMMVVGFGMAGAALRRRHGGGLRQAVCAPAEALKPIMLAHRQSEANKGQNSSITDKFQ